MLQQKWTGTYEHLSLQTEILSFFNLLGIKDPSKLAASDQGSVVHESLRWNTILLDS